MSFSFLFRYLCQYLCYFQFCYQFFVIHFFLPISIEDISNCNFIWFNLIWFNCVELLSLSHFILLLLIIDFAKLFTTISIFFRHFRFSFDNCFFLSSNSEHVSWANIAFFNKCYLCAIQNRCLYIDFINHFSQWSTKIGAFLLIWIKMNWIKIFNAPIYRKWESHITITKSSHFARITKFAVPQTKQCNLFKKAFDQICATFFLRGFPLFSVWHWYLKLFKMTITFLHFNHSNSVWFYLFYSFWFIFLLLFLRYIISVWFFFCYRYFVDFYQLQTNYKSHIKTKQKISSSIR